MVAAALAYLIVGFLSGMVLESLTDEERPGMVMIWVVFWGPIALALAVRWVREHL